MAAFYLTWTLDKTKGVRKNEKRGSQILIHNCFGFEQFESNTIALANSVPNSEVQKLQIETNKLNFFLKNQSWIFPKKR